MTERLAVTAVRTTPIPDQLLDEVETVAIMLGRLLAAQHGQEGSTGIPTGPRLLMLHVLAEANSSKVSDLAVLLGIKAPAASSLIDSLECEGLVARIPDAKDLRVTRISLTDEGRKALHEAFAARRQEMRNLLSVLTDEDIVTLIRIHRTLIATMVGADL